MKPSSRPGCLRALAAIIVATLAVAPIAAQPEQPDPTPTLKLAPTGRLLIDGAAFASPEKEEFTDGMAIPDVRLGLKGSYGAWSGKIDVAYASAKVSLKDLFIQYDFNAANFLRVGNFIHQYGYQVSTSSSMKPTFVEPISNRLFTAGRQIGLMAQHTGRRYLATLSVHTEPNSATSSPNDLHGQGLGVLSRQLWRPVTSNSGTMLQVGLSGGYASPQTRGDEHDGYSFSANFPTAVVKVAADKATLSNARSLWKFSPELMAAYGRFALETQYFFTRVNFKQGLRHWTGHGFYADLRALILGSHYGYSSQAGCIATPPPGSLELTLLYDYASLSDPTAQQLGTDGQVITGIYGGRSNTLSATLTYYINRYFLARLNYAYTYRWDASQLSGFNANATFNVVQARLQFIF